MKVYRFHRKSRYWAGPTDSVTPGDLVRQWRKPEHERTGELHESVITLIAASNSVYRRDLPADWGAVPRHTGYTQIGIEIEDADVIALFYSLIEQYQQEGKQAKALDVCARAIKRLATAYRKNCTGRDGGKA